MHRHIYDINLGWGQFLDFYSDLNNARKENDEKYVERNYIGEEIAEPDERPLMNEDLIDAYDDAYGKSDLDQRSDKNDSMIENFNNLAGQIESSKGAGNLLIDLQNEIHEEERKAMSDNHVG